VRPQNRDLTGRFLAGQSGNPGGRPGGFRSHIKDSTDEGSELIEFVLSVFRGDHGEDIRQRMDAATWLADRGFGKPVVNNQPELPVDYAFTIDIGTPLQDNGMPPLLEP